MPSAHALVPLWNRAAEWERRLAMVRNARSFLYLSTFYIEWDAYGIEMLSALQASQQRGVEVRLLIDGFGQRLGGVLMSFRERAALAGALDALRAAGGVVAIYRPPRWTQWALGGGQHVKIQVSEAGEAIFGSSNITRSSYEGWNEYSVAVTGPVAGALLRSYQELGFPPVSDHLKQLDGTNSPKAGDIFLDYWLCNPNVGQGWAGPFGWKGSNEVTDRMIGMIEAARSSLQITSFYFKPAPPLLEAVLRAARRGVRVEVFHSHRDALPATDLAWIGAAANYGRMHQAGVAIYENRRGEHSKIVLVDDAWAAFGSYNFEDAAHDRLAEAMMASRDRRAVEPARAIFDELRCHPDNETMTPVSFSNLPARLKARIARYGRFKWWI